MVSAKVDAEIHMEPLCRVSTRTIIGIVPSLAYSIHRHFCFKQHILHEHLESVKGKVLRKRETHTQERKREREKERERDPSNTTRDLA
jgi:hypothetical protein